MKKKQSVYVLLVFVWLNTLFIYGQTRKEDELYTKLKKVKLFKSNRQNVEVLFKYMTRKETDESNGYQTVYYELTGAKLTVDYSTGRCSEHGSSEGYNVNRNVVIGTDLFYFEPIKLINFDFNLAKFEKYAETDNNAIIYTNDELGIELTGGEGLLSSIEFSPTEKEEEKYRCKPPASKSANQK